MKQISIEEVKTIEFDILKHIDKFCTSNNIKYVLASGTLLGAIRHKGFIPWDDDIDIFMLREDYDRFISEYKSKDNSFYHLLMPDTAENYAFGYAKVEDSRTLLREWGRNIYGGIYIDVFPLDYCSEDETFNKKTLARILKIYHTYGGRYSHYEPDRSFLLNVYELLRKVKTYFMPIRKHFLEIDTLAKNISGGKKTDKVCCFAFIHKYWPWPTDIFDKTIEGEFEGHPFPIPEKYDELLRILYGNYMEYPPLEQRNSGHKFVVLQYKDECIS